MTTGWRDHILKEFTPEVARLTLVADPDGLLAEEGLLQGICERGFELISFEDPVAFRFAYESKYRSSWDRGEQTELVVVLRSSMPDLRSLPFDLLEAGRKLTFTLGSIFPNLSYPVIDALDRGDLDALYSACAQHNPGKLGDNATKDFVLRHVFEIAPELMKQVTDLLRVLLRRHHRGQRIPSSLDARFIQIIKQSGRFDDWPIESIVSDREAFFRFLQERWPVFLDHLAKGEVKEVHEPEAVYDLEYSGPAQIPFDHDDVRVYIDTLFLEGTLRPVSHPRSDVLSREWVAVGVATNREADHRRRLEGLLESLESTIPSSEAKHQEWLAFAHRWAELNVLWREAPALDSQFETGNRIRRLQGQFDAAFLAWVQKRYGGLYNQPPLPPVMVHHIARSMARYLERSANEKAALVVVDGLALDQWVVLRDTLLERRPDLRLREGAVFAWAPTITSVSRQAVFAGRPPVYFPGSIFSTDKEGSLWAKFWTDQGLASAEVVYLKGLGEGSTNSLEEVVLHPKVRVAGLVVDKVDKIMHGMELGTAGMHNQVRQWAEQGWLSNLLDLLLDHGFVVFLTSDHGNVEAVGCGSPSEGAVADLRGQRARVYPDQLLRKKVTDKYPDAIEWQPFGLPNDYLPLLAPDRTAFVPKGETIVAHGGVTIEELIVPFVELARRPA